MRNSISFFKLFLFLFFISCGSVFGQQTQSSTDHLIHYRQGKSFLKLEIIWLPKRHLGPIYMVWQKQMLKCSVKNISWISIVHVFNLFYASRGWGFGQSFCRKLSKNPYSADLVRDLGIYFYEAGIGNALSSICPKLHWPI